jgi:hypothetical protein
LDRIPDRNDPARELSIVRDSVRLMRSRCGNVMPLIEEGADGMMPSAQSLRGYECAGRKRTFTKPDAMGDGIKIRSAQNLKTSPVILACSANGVPKLP